MPLPNWLADMMRKGRARRVGDTLQRAAAAAPRFRRLVSAAPERKLTTILSADVVGYSRLMGQDEPGTLAMLKTCRELMRRLISRRRGRIVGQAGDAVLAEFPSVVLAVECAVEIQRELAERNAIVPEERRMRFRIGVNLGDVMVEGDDLFGDGVNIAARLQALAEPGGILISGSVFEQVRNKLALGFDFLGPQAVKNISDEVPAYRVLLDGEAPAAIGAASAGGAGAASPFPLRERVGPGAGRGREDRAASAHPVRGESPHPAAPQPPTKEERRGRKPHPYRSFRERLARRATLAAVFIAFFLAINLLTWTDRAGAWFQWPTLGVLFVFALRTIWVWWR